MDFNYEAEKYQREDSNSINKANPIADKYKHFLLKSQIITWLFLTICEISKDKDDLRWFLFGGKSLFYEINPTYNSLNISIIQFIYLPKIGPFHPVIDIKFLYPIREGLID